MMLVPRAADAIRSERIVWDFDAGIWSLPPTRDGVMVMFIQPEHTQEQGVYQY
jgi:hypothetical protein